MVRQIGPTLFPTVYAGFLTGGAKQIEPTLKAEFGNDLIDFETGTVADQGESVGDIMSQIEKIPDETVREQVLQTVSSVYKVGFDHMFITSGILSLLVIAVGVYLYSHSQKIK